MKRLVFLASLVLLISCADQKVNKEDLHHLNGYWEIQKVEFPNGQIKEYKANTVVDYIQIDGEKGMRKKVQPKLDGTFIITEDEESFDLIAKNEGYSFHYNNGLSERQEKLTTLDSLSFSTQNEEGIRYFYIRFEPISIQF
ncbi:hypothetical protein [Flagellimonas meridianipacifica]|uniref:Lipocalin-like domain-containing protein n=1 Tax=Flagellimonas meridianipacifica TaxID=1080225 RepID=A0A2T0M9Q0_9FLAO|nr:hypothetical protein [Allomuricauda pacifica]PRX54203.1 hypothetical protein CLV81_2600 [Allomuricauda pacifica]